MPLFRFNPAWCSPLRSAEGSPVDPAGGSPDQGSDDAIDLDLLAKGIKGDRSAFGALYERHKKRIFASCFKMMHDPSLAEEMTQETFVKLLRGAEKFDGRARFTTWLTRVAMNVCLSKLRAEKLRRHASLDAPTKDREHGRGVDLEQQRELSLGSRVEAEEDVGRLRAALATLDPEQRVVLLLADSHGRSYESIAAVMGVAVGTVKSRLFRARVALREAMESSEAAPKADEKSGRTGTSER